MTKTTATEMAPEGIQQQLAALVQMAGRDDLEVEVRVNPGSTHTCIEFDGIADGAPAKILLGSHDIRASTESLHTVLGHELAHLLRRRDGVSFIGVPSALRHRTGLQALAVYTVGVLGGLVVVVDSALHDHAVLASVGSALIVTSILLTLAIVSRPRRADELATDILAATRFGAVLTLADVQRFRESEGWLASHLPTFVRDHLKPALRRQVQLAALHAMH